MVLPSTRPFGEIAERRASRGLWSRGRERSERSECVSASVCASASARAYVRVRQRERSEESECVSTSVCASASARAEREANTKK